MEFAYFDFPSACGFFDVLCFSAILVEKKIPLNGIALSIFSASISLSCISFRNFLMRQELHFEQLMVEQHLVSRVRLGVGFPCIELDGGVGHLMLKIEKHLL